MKPPAFDYASPESIDECVALMSEYGDDAKIIAGGQSLMPLLALRMVRPSVVIDIGRIEELRRWKLESGVVRIGALVRQRSLEFDSELRQLLPLMAEAVHLIGHPATRSRGTIVGSMCHADPAAELPVCAILLGAEFVLRSTRGQRLLRAEDFFVDALSTAVEDDEFVAEVRIPVASGDAGYAFCEIARRHGDFALVSVAGVVDLQGHARVALGGVARSPVQFDFGTMNGGKRFDPASAETFGLQVARAVEPEQDLHASAEYRKAVAATLVERTVMSAFHRLKSRS